MLGASRSESPWRGETSREAVQGGWRSRGEEGRDNLEKQRRRSAWVFRRPFRVATVAAPSTIDRS